MLQIMSEGLQCWTTAALLREATQLGLDGKEGKTFEATVPETFRGDVLGLHVGAALDETVAVKTFRAKKSANRILKEARLQQVCAAKQVSPPVLGVSVSEKYIVMPKLASLPVDTYRGAALPEDLQYAICALMGLMDEADVLHNDMNARNVMLDSQGRPWMIDFGLAKAMTPKVRKKNGAHPNVSVTLWGLVRGFKRYKVQCPIMDACLKSDDPLPYIEQGKAILKKKKRRQRKRKRRHDSK